jgi:hypothetical protein
LGRNGLEIAAFSNRDRRLLKEFVHFPWRLHRNDPLYAPLLDMELVGSRLLRIPGLLTEEHPFHRHAEVVYFLVYRGGRVAGRIAGCIEHSYNAHNEKKDVIFGFFESENDAETAAALVGSVAAWGAERGMTRLLGPMSFTTNHVIGVLVDGFETPPFFQTSHNPAYYGALLEQQGLRKAMDVIAQVLDLRDKAFQEAFARYRRTAEQVERRAGLVFRNPDMKHFQREQAVLREVYNDAWKENWGATPFTDAEFSLLAKQMRAACDPRTIQFAFAGQEPVGIAVSMPDMNDCLRPGAFLLGRSDWFRLARMAWRRRRTRRSRALLLGVKKSHRRTGVAEALVARNLQGLLDAKQYDTLELSWLLETNTAVIRIGECLNAKRYKTWRIYEKAISGAPSQADVSRT